MWAAIGMEHGGRERELSCGNAVVELHVMPNREIRKDATANDLRSHGVAIRYDPHLKTRLA